MTMESLWGATQKATNNRNFELLPKGSYTAKLSNAVFDSSNGKDMIKFEFTILEGNFRTRKVWKNWYLTEKTIPYIKLELERASAEVPEKYDDIPRVLCDMYNKTYQIFVSVKEAQGQYEAKNEASISKLLVPNGSVTPSRVDQITASLEDSQIGF